MKKLLLIFIMFFSCNIYVFASVDSAYEYVLMDADSGQVILGKKYHTPLLIASITKIMTCILAIESGKVNDMVEVSDVIHESYGSGIYIEVGEKIKLLDLLYGLMLRSGNDAALMVSSYVAGDVDSFVHMMNQKAIELGMAHTDFVNPSGLDNSDRGNYSTAYDMALLTRYAMKNKIYRDIVQTKSYTVKTNKKTYVWKNKNKLLQEEYITGGKTGYTEKALRTLVSTASSDNMNFIVVTLRDSDDWNTHKDLYQYAFSHYASYLVMNKNKFRVIGDTYYYGNFYIKNPIYLTLKKDTKDSLIGRVLLFRKKSYKNHDVVGEYQVYLGNKLMHTESIYIKDINLKKKRFGLI